MASVVTQAALTLTTHHKAVVAPKVAMLARTGRAVAVGRTVVLVALAHQPSVVLVDPALPVVLVALAAVVAVVALVSLALPALAVATAGLARQQPLLAQHRAARMSPVRMRSPVGEAVGVLVVRLAQHRAVAALGQRQRQERLARPIRVVAVAVGVVVLPSAAMAVLAS